MLGPRSVWLLYLQELILCLSWLSIDGVLEKSQPPSQVRLPDPEQVVKVQPCHLIHCTASFRDAPWFTKPTVNLDREDTSQGPWSVNEQNFPGGPHCRARVYLLWPFMRKRWLPVDLDTEDQLSNVRMPQVLRQPPATWKSASPQ